MVISLHHPVQRSRPINRGTKRGQIVQLTRSINRTTKRKTIQPPGRSNEWFGKHDCTRETGQSQEFARQTNNCTEKISLVFDVDARKDKLAMNSRPRKIKNIVDLFLFYRRSIITIDILIVSLDTEQHRRMFLFGVVIYEALAWE